jgi:hypothetical protein
LCFSAVALRIKKDAPALHPWGAGFKKRASPPIHGLPARSIYMFFQV